MQSEKQSRVYVTVRAKGRKSVTTTIYDATLPQTVKAIRALARLRNGRRGGNFKGVEGV